MAFVNARQSVRAAIESEKKKDKSYLDANEIVINYPRGQMIINVGDYLGSLIVPQYRLKKMISIICLDEQSNIFTNLEILNYKFHCLKLMLTNYPEAFNKREAKYLIKNHQIVEDTLSKLF